MHDFEPGYYELLEIEKDASTDDIKSAFRKQAKRHHPDTSHEADENFVRLRKAYETLIDRVKREKYDRYLQVLVGSKNLIEVRTAMRDLYDDMVGYLVSMAGFGNRSEYELVLKKKSYNEDKIIRAQLPLVEICRRCMGTGGTIFRQCSRCGGKGKIEYAESVDLFIPAGSKEGESMMISVPGQKVKLTLKYE
jgi:molecular chaperone DnaJ